MEILNSVLGLFSLVSLLLVVYLIIKLNKQSEKIELLNKKNLDFLESIEKYVEIFNEQNVRELLESSDTEKENRANKMINSIKKEYQKKLTTNNSPLTEEHKMLIDFVALSLSLLIKTPPNLRAKLIEENTDNEIIRKILTSKLFSIQNHYIPVSILEVAISKGDE